MGRTILLATFLLASIFCPTQSSIVQLTDESWFQTSFDNWVILFCSSWHPACHRFLPEFVSFGHWSDDQKTRVALVNFTTDPGLVSRFFITKLPTLVHAENGVYREITENIVNFRYRDLRHLVDWDSKFRKYPQLPSYRRPNTWWMTIFSDFIHFAMTNSTFRTVHRFLVRKYFLPFSLFYFLVPIYYALMALFYFIFIRIFLLLTNLPPIRNPQRAMRIPKRSSSVLNRRLILMPGERDSQDAPLFRKYVHDNHLSSKAKKCKKEILASQHMSRKSYVAKISDLIKEFEGKRHLDDCYSDYDDYSHESRRKSRVKLSDRSSLSSRDNSSDNPTCSRIKQDFISVTSSFEQRL
ncbi:uncharacterized protein LOC141853352 [Brevipalpus obovatus]|uniref:uncharacterized protein LOC141853352 n=1 Tax=Brevipalpus obovatus TaxID=246614 RepID=UPI003D9E306E